MILKVFVKKNLTKTIFTESSLNKFLLGVENEKKNLNSLKKREY